jgi:hypothetical protein
MQFDTIRPKSRIVSNGPYTLESLEKKKNQWKRESTGRIDRATAELVELADRIE